jgi:Fibronectin type III domain
MQTSPVSAIVGFVFSGLLVRLPAMLAVAGLMLVLASEAWAAFTGGPSVRVSPNTKVEIRWTANFVGDGKVEIFDNPNGGVPIDGKTSLAAAGHTIEFSVGGLLQADRTYFFRVIHKDPTNVRPDLTNDPAPYPPFFTGAQAISNVHTESITNNSAVIAWDANVIGFGSVVYGTTALDQGPVEDSFNTTNHAIELTGLSPGTTYQFRVSNKHAIDGDSLAEATGEFTTAGPPLPVAHTSWGNLKALYR